MQLGIAAKDLRRATLGELFAAVRSYGLDCVQFNMVCAGLEAMPQGIEPDLCDRIREALAAAGVSMAAVSGTFNMAHPDPAVREEGLRRLAVLAGSCGRMGTSIITLSTGTRHPTSLWRRHPDNDTPEAWRDSVATIRRAVRIAEEHSVTLAFEPEVANVVDSARKARRLLDEIGSPRLGVLLDGANLFHHGELARMAEILDEAFELLGRDLVLAHAKDLSHDGDAGHEAAGTGLLDYDRYLGLLRQSGFSGGLILHTLQESQVPGCVAFLRGKMAGAQ